ncbi:MAG: hypothetical protein NWF07_13740, partial [Candidatus Bathyarchaeota archaeon]|nr:hypothetical protein [Candidatus Bathyarchaeota archaeon]
MLFVLVVAVVVLSAILVMDALTPKSEPVVVHMKEVEMKDCTIVSSISTQDLLYDTLYECNVGPMEVFNRKLELLRERKILVIGGVMG